MAGIYSGPWGCHRSAERKSRGAGKGQVCAFAVGLAGGWHLTGMVRGVPSCVLCPVSCVLCPVSRNHCSRQRAGASAPALKIAIKKEARYRGLFHVIKDQEPVSFCFRVPFSQRWFWPPWFWWSILQRLNATGWPVSWPVPLQPVWLLFWSRCLRFPKIR